MFDVRGAALVFAGGAVGTLARFLVDGAISGATGGLSGIPLGILVINVAGAFLLGLLVQGLAPDGGDEWRATWLLLGTGALGGFTTYSALSAGIAELLLGGQVGLGAVYGALTLVGGGLASWLGMLAGGAVRAVLARRPSGAAR